MKLVGRLLWLLLGLIYRLVMLVLFEKWIPFPDRPELRPPVFTPKQRGKQREKPKAKEPVIASRQGTSRMARFREPLNARSPAPFFEATSSELSGELAARLEGEHWLHGQARRARVLGAPRQRETLSGLLRDKRAVRDAVVLGSALAVRRSKP